MTDDELRTYKQIKERIAQLEKKLELLEGEIPARVVREKIEGKRLTLKANQEMLLFLFGENNLIH